MIKVTEVFVDTVDNETSVDVTEYESRVEFFKYLEELDVRLANMYDSETFGLCMMGTESFGVEGTDLDDYEVVVDRTIVTEFKLEGDMFFIEYTIEDC